MASRLKTIVKAARSRGAFWVRTLDLLRVLISEGGASRLWTQIVHRDAVHQTTPHTAEDRYPDLMDQVAVLCPKAERILSFGCSTGAELVAIRRQFPEAVIVGVEINPRSRVLATRRVAGDPQTIVLPPDSLDGTFDVIFALAVLQRLPHQVEETALEDISELYPFQKFDAAVTALVRRLIPGGLLCVFHAHFPVEFTSIFPNLETVEDSPLLQSPLFGRDGRRLAEVHARSIFRRV